MACSTIHLAIAKEYMKNHPEFHFDYDSFCAGTLYPDACIDNDKSHYTEQDRGIDNVSHVQSKVNLYSFLKENDVCDSFLKGWFLHLVTDYLFFNELFSKEYLLSTSYHEFCNDLYHAYRCLNLYLEEKYKIMESDYKAYPSERYPGIPYETCILSKEEINQFIKRVSSINLDAYEKKIRNAKENVFP